jgi:hypothetical protein
MTLETIQIPGASKPKPNQAACRETGHKFKVIQAKILQSAAKNQHPITENHTNIPPQPGEPPQGV